MQCTCSNNHFIHLYSWYGVRTKYRRAKTKVTPTTVPQDMSRSVKTWKNWWLAPQMCRCVWRGISTVSTTQLPHKNSTWVTQNSGSKTKHTGCWYDLRGFVPLAILTCPSAWSLRSMKWHASQPLCLPFPKSVIRPCLSSSQHWQYGGFLK